LPIEYINNLNQSQQHLYYLYAQGKFGSNNFPNEKMSFINFITEQLEKNVHTQVKGLEYIIRALTVCQRVLLRPATAF